MLPPLKAKLGGPPNKNNLALLFATAYTDAPTLIDKNNYESRSYKTGMETLPHCVSSDESSDRNGTCPTMLIRRYKIDYLNKKITLVSEG